MKNLIYISLLFLSLPAIAQVDTTLETPNLIAPIGYVGIGTTSPASKFHVIGSSQFDDPVLMRSILSLESRLYLTNLRKSTLEARTFLSVLPDGEIVNEDIESLRRKIFSLTDLEITASADSCLFSDGTTSKPQSIWIYEGGEILTGPCQTRVGINVDQPTSPLDIRAIGSTSGTAIQSAGAIKINVLKTFSTKRIYLSISDPGGSDVFRVYDSGAVYATEYNARLKSDFPDYVFKPNYQLMPLKDLEAYINQYQHLPNIPSAEEVKEQGSVDLAEMQRLQMEKIEELTLYIIELNKKLEEANKKIEALQSN